MDEAGVHRPQIRFDEPERLQGLRAMILDQDVRRFDQAPHHCFARGRCKVEGNRFLAGGLGEIGGAHTRLGPFGIAAAAVAHGIAAVKRLDLDDLCAEQAEEVGAGRPRQDMGEVDDPEAAKGGGEGLIAHGRAALKRLPARRRGPAG